MVALFIFLVVGTIVGVLGLMAWGCVKGVMGWG